MNYAVIREQGSIVKPAKYRIVRLLSSDSVCYHVTVGRFSKSTMLCMVGTGRRIVCVGERTKCERFVKG